MNMLIQSLHKTDIAPYIKDVARLRIEVFYEFPYLYEGDMAYEQRYIENFALAKDSILVLAFDGTEIVGASTGLPLAEEPAHIQAPFAARGCDVSRVFYFSESVLRPEYRGRGVGVEFFRRRESWARQLGRFDLLAFCAVIRPDEHHLKPADHQLLDGFWQQRGFSPTDMQCYMSWKDRDEQEESEKPLRFWIKSIKTP